MQIGGIQKCSLIDYPGKVSTVIFTQGCNFRCPYCHNSSLVSLKKNNSAITEEGFFNFLKTRIGKIEGVVVSGGEPTIHKDIKRFLKKIKNLGFFVKLDTNGSNPRVLREVIDKDLVDFIAMDVKTSIENYCKAIGVSINKNLIMESIQAIKNSSINYQFRTTVVKSLCNEEDIKDIVSLIGNVKQYVLQKFCGSTAVLDRKILFQEEYSNKQFEGLKRKYEIILTEG